MANSQSWSGGESRKINKRIVVEGTMTLQTPAHFGSGDDQGSVMPLIFDETSNQALLTGASIAGALRGYLGSFEDGYRQKQRTGSLATKLFGGIKQDKDGTQSNLIINDAYGTQSKEKPLVELRDGVKIDPTSRTAEDKALYSFMVWTEDTKFNLHFELLICKSDDEKELTQALATALNGLQNGEITLGARKHRGFGRVTVTDWRVREFDMQTRDGLIAWIREGGDTLTNANKEEAVGFFNSLNNTELKITDKRKRFTLEANFDLESSILIRADSIVADRGHLRSDGKPIVSGTSLAGAIRARALKIANTVIPNNGTDDNKKAKKLIDDLFGKHGDKKGESNDTNTDGKEERASSRIIIEERKITGGETERWVQSRVAIDRFTGGALDTALFNQQPQFGGKVCVKFEVRFPEKKAEHELSRDEFYPEAEIGLLLLVLKDLWTADLPLGGESSVGRGRLRGQNATLTYEGKTWKITQDGKKLKIDGDKDALEKFVAALNELPKEVSAA